MALALVCLFTLPLFAQQDSWEIVRAEYGSGQNWVDVTEQVRSLVQGDSLDFRVTGDALGAASRRGRNRVLRLQLVDANGRTRQMRFRENQQVRLQVRNAYQASLRVTRATYGVGNRTLNVTSRLNQQIQQGQLNLVVNNQTMGGDPAPGRDKVLTVQFTLNGRNDQRVVREGESLRLADVNAGTRTLQITSAIYGSGYRTNNVTSRLNSLIQQNQVAVQVNNQTMGGDPAPNQAKQLTVRYTLNGSSDEVVISEGQMLRLPYDTAGDMSQRIRCESLENNGNRRQYCSAYTGGGVRLSRNLGSSPCVQNSSWGYDSSGVWVDRGCRAEFELQTNSGAYGESGSYGTNNQTYGSLTSTTLPSGTDIAVRTNEPIDSKTASSGQTFSAVIAEDVVDRSGAVTIPRGAEAQLVIRSASGDSSGSSSDLVLDLNSLTVGGTRYLVSTGDLERDGGSGIGANKKTAIMVGGGAALGTLIGAIVGGGKGAAIGAAIGAGAGVGTQVLTRGGRVQVPVETVLNFRLDQDLYLQAVR